MQPPRPTDKARLSPVARPPTSTRPPAPGRPPVPARPETASAVALEQRLGYHFRSPELLERAITHSSAAREQGEEVVESQRLEFLGDAVLGFLVGEMIYRRGPNLAEGPMSRLRAALVQEATLAERARALGIPAAVRLGKGEEQSGGRGKPSIQSDVYEAVLAAVYLDGGIEAVRAFVDRQFSALLEREIGRGSEGPIETRPERDPKTALQEWLQARERPLPLYRSLGASGPDHARRYAVEVTVPGGVTARGEASSKRGAEARAAQAALASLRSRAKRGRGEVSKGVAPKGGAPGGAHARQTKGEQLSPGRGAGARAGRKSPGSRRAPAR